MSPPTLTLTEKQQKFMSAYVGNGVDAARQAGYKGSDNVLNQMARANLRNPTIREAIQKRQDVEIEAIIASRQERQEFWTATMEDKDEAARDRLRASELLGRSEADFTETKVHEIGASIADIINIASAPNPPDAAEVLETPDPEPVV